jgi:hypothetical protein
MGCMGSSEQSMGTTSYRAIAILAACTKATDGAAAAKGSQEVLRSSSVMLVAKLANILSGSSVLTTKSLL